MYECNRHQQSSPGKEMHQAWPGRFRTNPRAHPSHRKPPFTYFLQSSPSMACVLLSQNWMGESNSRWGMALRMASSTPPTSCTPSLPGTAMLVSDFQNLFPSTSLNPLSLSLVFSVRLSPRGSSSRKSRAEWGPLAFIASRVLFFGRCEGEKTPQNGEIPSMHFI